MAEGRFYLGLAWVGQMFDSKGYNPFPLSGPETTTDPAKRKEAFGRALETHFNG